MSNVLKQPIHILEVFGRMDQGGAEAMIMNLYRKIDKSKVQFDFMVHTDKDCYYDDEIKQLGGRIYHIPRFHVTNFIEYRNLWKSFFKNHSEIKVVHGHCGGSASIYLHEANQAGCFTIAHSHSSWKSTKNKYGIAHYAFSYPTRFIAKCFFGCSTEAGISRYGRHIVKSSKYMNFFNAIDLKKFKYNENQRIIIKEKLGISSDTKVIIHVGRVVSAKNPLMIMNVFREIVKRYPKTICLWVGNGYLEKTYRLIIKNENLQERILMMGGRSDIPDLLMVADSFLFPSLFEGLPVSVIEAQASGLPCIISDTISKEVEVSSLVEWHSLSESPEIWAERCVNLAESNRKIRKSPLDSLREAGYDIEKSVQWLTDFYIKNAKNNKKS